MNKKIKWLSLAICVLFVINTLSSAVNVKTCLIRTNSKNPLTNTFAPKEDIGNSSTGEIGVYYFRKDGGFEKTVKRLTFDDKEDLMNKLNQTVRSNLTLKEKFEKELEILKEYELVSINITLEDILDVEKLEGYNPQKNQQKIGIEDSFTAHYAPTLILGVGFAGGIGYEKRLFNSFSFLLAIVPVGTVLCFDPCECVLYTLTSFIPLFMLGFLARYTGLIMFAVFPGYFYSNIIALGFVSFTCWGLFSPLGK